MFAGKGAVPPLAPTSIVSVVCEAIKVAPQEVFMPSTAIWIPIIVAFTAPSMMTCGPEHVGQ
ncbi:hypothetical protein ASD28_03755 [Massilia sp. Root133]|nr:hypothetical protein ASD28_03755 [Massilia sp. Root133]KQZ46370.1 hypothetical protein ASD92_26040 [Massilia sp. Root1485]